MIEYILFVVGIILLIKGAGYLVDGSSSLAKKLGVSSLVIGLTVVAFGTSMPELVVNVIAALSGNGDIAFGNIIGSNISNILLMLGIIAMIAGIKGHSSTTWKEIPYSLLGVLILLIFASGLFANNLGLNYISRIGGCILLILFASFLYYAFKMMRANKKTGELKDADIQKMPSLKIALYIIGGLVALYLGGKWTVEGAVAFAQLLGMSEYFISLTVVAVGTSLPELITSIIATIRKEGDLAIGNIVGSNIFNIFWILGLGSVITPIAIPASAIFDLIILVIATVALFLFLFVGKKHELERWQGVVFVLMYVAYIVFLIFRG